MSGRGGGGMSGGARAATFLRQFEGRVQESRCVFRLLEGKTSRPGRTDPQENAVTSHDQLAKSLIGTFFAEFLRLTAPDSAPLLRMAEATLAHKQRFTDRPPRARRAPV